MGEKWKEVQGYEGRYMISASGKVFSFLTNKYRKPVFNHRGYYFMRLSDSEHKYKTNYIHKMVARAFIPNSENKPQVNHIDGNKTNNLIDNLEWCTNDENMAHAKANGLIKPHKGKEHWHCRLTEEQAKDIKYSLMSTKELMKEYRASYSMVYGIKSGKRWKHI